MNIFRDIGLIIKLTIILSQHVQSIRMLVIIRRILSYNVRNFLTAWKIKIISNKFFLNVFKYWKSLFINLNE